MTANVAFAVNPELTYVRAKTGRRNLLFCRRARCQTRFDPATKFSRNFSGAELVGLTYSGPFDDIPFQQELQARRPRRVVVAWDDVGETEGTGIVHIAPGCGAEDYELGKRENLGLIVPTDQSAHFLPGAGPLAELHALEDVEVIFEKLRERDRLYRMQRYKHSYPHCWRCGTN